MYRNDFSKELSKLKNIYKPTCEKNKGFVKKKIKVVFFLVVANKK